LNNLDELDNDITVLLSYGGRVRAFLAWRDVMLEIKSKAYNNKSGVAYLSEEVYELTQDVLHYKKGDKVRLISDVNQVDKLGFHKFDPENYLVVCQDGCQLAEYCKVLKTSIRPVPEA
jgi:hypothetical protein